MSKIVKTSIQWPEEMHLMVEKSFIWEMKAGDEQKQIRR